MGITNDDIYEHTESFTVSLDSLGPYVVFPSGRGVVTVDITDNELPPTLSVNNVPVEEVAAGANAVFTFSLSGQSAYPTIVTWSTVAGSATAGSDYTAVTGVRFHSRLID